MSIKIYVHYENSSKPDCNKTTKMTVPKKWVEEKFISDVVSLFVGGYNTKFPENALNASEMHLETKEQEKLYSTSPISGLSEHGDYFLKHGEYVPAPTVFRAASDPSRLRCKNYGCKATYLEEENNDQACKHHIKPPMFHDTVKGWTCCKERRALDWEEFERIEGCALGRHSQVDPQLLYAASPSNPTGGGSLQAGGGSVPAPPLAAVKSISSYNEANPLAKTAAQGAAKIISARKSTRRPDGTARCLHKGCQKDFAVADNAADSTACVYHSGQPVFHDAAKYWSCCPQKKCYDFDEFMAVAGCTTGRHDDGEDV